MKKRFSDEELVVLRNQIPIRFLIETILAIPSKFIENIFRFLCPVCSEFNTSIIPDSNIVKCFSCNRIFNTIDITMTSKKYDFVTSVTFLKEIYKKTKMDQNRKNGSKSNKWMNNIPQIKSKELICVGDVLNHSTNPIINQIYTPSQLTRNFEKLELKLDSIMEEIQQIKKFLFHLAR